MRGFLPVLLVSVVAGGCNIQVGDNGVSIGVGARARDEWTRTYMLPEGGRLEIVNVTGEIRASAAEGREVQVRAEREVRGDSEDEARARLASLDMGEQVAPDSVRIEAVSPNPEERGRRSVNISYQVAIPAGLSVILRTENGRIRLENVSGQIQAVTSNGGIDGEGLAGSLVAEVVNGGIEVDLVSVSGDVTLSSVNGGIELDLPADVRATLEATCVNGGINVDDRLGMTVAESTRRRVSGTLNGGGVKISASTVNGGVRIGPRQAP